jgi:hypothetical protein
MTPQESPKLGLTGRTIKSVRASAVVLAVDFEGEAHLVFTPELEGKKLNMRATVCVGPLPKYAMLVEILSAEAKVVYGRMVLTEGVMLRQFGPSLVLGFDEGLSMVIPLGGGPINVEKDGVVLGPPKVRLN